ncbi:SPOR domain-containing protein [Thermus oshimai]|jgi:cell division protein FtsN|uniref:SPOR domain-containing protein n=1 Tax=Thermus oshimai TaxID=56957 RepID=UPI0031FB985F
MRWLRENWLDFLIFLLIALVAAGVVLYLTGVNPFARPRPEGVAPPPAPSVPAAPAPSEPASPNPPSEAPAPEPVVTVLPLPQAPREAPTPPEPQKPTQEAPRPAPPQASPTGAYRVVVGAFADPKNATRLAQELSAQGYPVRLEAAGALTRVAVGPYASEAEAARVAQALQAYGARVYRGQGPLPPQGGVYLQVGAFQKEENALALAEKLKGEGLPVTLVRDGLYRVRVGPVAEGEKEGYLNRLRALGLEPVEVR